MRFLVNLDSLSFHWSIFFIDGFDFASIFLRPCFGTSSTLLRLRFDTASTMSRRRPEESTNLVRRRCVKAGVCAILMIVGWTGVFLFIFRLPCVALLILGGALFFFFFECITFSNILLFPLWGWVANL
ncbi:hypothetical protein LX69_00316 [Breznakibacter xylanolyticus]|uniref:Transmembrane protein n=1 Tax=Breznakibacter xylanolyticus TaxID=990 RepID=A0A2W7QEI1_9BACT|nr:hypothetical protein LX69_00316 [Breznakibacter xylanolyticus]